MSDCWVLSPKGPANHLLTVHRTSYKREQEDRVHQHFIMDEGGAGKTLPLPEKLTKAVASWGERESHIPQSPSLSFPCLSEELLSSTHSRNLLGRKGSSAGAGMNRRDQWKKYDTHAGFSHGDLQATQAIVKAIGCCSQTEVNTYTTHWT